MWRLVSIPFQPPATYAVEAMAAAALVAVVADEDVEEEPQPASRLASAAAISARRGLMSGGEAWLLFPSFTLRPPEKALRLGISQLARGARVCGVRARISAAGF